MRISEVDLRAMAQIGDGEFRVVDQAGGGKQVDSQVGSFLGRVMRNLKIGFGEDRTDKQTAYIEAKESVRQSLRAIYGPEVGEKAFRAGIGHYNDQGQWGTSANHPITGRHIAKMLRAAEDELNRYPGLTTLMSDVLNDGVANRHVVIGDKVSTPTGRVAIDTACRGAVEDLKRDAQQLTEEGKEHGFWILPFALKGRVNGSDVAHIGIHMDLKNPDRVTIIDVDGERVDVNTEELARTIEDICSNSLRKEVGSMALFRADGLTKPEPNVVRFDLDDISGTGARSHTAHVYNNENSLDELYTEPEDIIIDDAAFDSERSLNIREDKDPMRPHANANMVSGFKPLRIDASGGSVDVGDRIPGLDDIVAIHRSRMETGSDSDRFDERVKTQGFTLRSGQEPPQKLVHVRQVMLGVRDPDGSPRPLPSNITGRLPHFLDDRLLQDIHRGLFPGRDPEDMPDISEVELEINTHWGDDRIPVFDITFRAKLPDGAVIGSDGNPPPNSVNLAVSLHVSRDEMFMPQPQFTVDAPRIEPR